MDDFSIVLQQSFRRLDTVEAFNAKGSPVGGQRWADIVGKRLRAIHPAAKWSVTPHASDESAMGFYLRVIRQLPSLKVYEVWQVAGWSPERVVTEIDSRRASLYELGADE